MGLDITAVSGLQKIDCGFTSDEEPMDMATGQEITDCVRLYRNTSFPCQFDDLEDGVVYRYAQRKRCYKASYRGYNRWREALAKLAEYPHGEYEEFTGHQIGAFGVEAGPFHELICFSDCEGTIGPKTSAKLYQDFCDFQDKANLSEDVAWIKNYYALKEAFQIASDNGAVIFS